MSKELDTSSAVEVQTLPAVVQPIGLEILGEKVELKNKLAKYEEIKEVIVDYIDHNFVLGVDFGPTDDRSPKATLKKPGAEKICRLFNTSPEWKMDRDTWEMLGSPKGTLCYICYIKDNLTGNIVGEGRGSDVVGNKSRDANKAIKNAEKCALVDACLYTFMLSEKFTQDGGGASALSQLKTIMMGEITALRMGIDSGMTDLLWLKEILKHELHKTQIVSIEEHNHIKAVIFDDEIYNLSTGEKK